MKPAWLNHHSNATRDLLPLPVLDVCARDASELLSEWRGIRDENWDVRTVHLADAWLEIVVCMLNSQVGAEANWWVPRSTQRVSLARLWEACFDVVFLDVAVPTSEELNGYLRACRIDYHGEIAVIAEELTWTRVAAALPPTESCAALQVETVCEGSALRYVENPASALEPNYESLPAPKHARVRM
eukprot:5217722-Amphidinium_carterae.1